MAEARLSVEVAADLRNVISQFAQGARVVESETGRMATSTNRVERSFTVLNNTRFTFGQNYARSSAQVVQASNAASTAVARSSRDYTGLARILQDLPFGFVGIQNNLTQILPAAGLAGLAVSALVSAFTFAQVGTSAWTRGLGENKKAINSVKKETEEYLSTLSQTTRAQVEGAKNAASELTTVRLLFAAYQDASLPLERRRDAYKQLQDQYPAYFGNLKFERTASEATTTAYNGLTTAILATARARAATDLITQNATRQLLNEQKVVDLSVDREKARLELRKAQAEFDKAQQRPGTAGSTFAGVVDGKSIALGKLTQAQNVLAGIDTEIRNLTTDSNLLTTANGRLEASVAKLVGQGAKLTGSVGSVGPSGPKDPGYTEPIKKITEFAGVVETTMQGIILNTNNLPQALSPIVDTTTSYYQLLREQNELLFRSFNAAFGGIGESIGTALAEGTSAIDAFGQAVFGVIGDVLVQFGKLTIAAGLASLGLSTALSAPLNPASGIAAIAAGTALVAVGAAVKSFSSNIGNGGDGGGGGASGTRRIPGFANGTGFAPGGTALVGERGPEIINLPRGSQVIPNHDLRGIGGSTTFELAGNLAVSGDQLVFLLDKTRSRKRRNG